MNTHLYWADKHFNDLIVSSEAVYKEFWKVIGISYQN